MNREILFRGKRDDNGGWVYGSLLNNRKDMVGSAYIIPFFVDSSNFDYIEVDPSTIGQFTGLYDKNGVKIFEGDIESSGGVVKLGIYEMHSDRSGFPTWIAERKNGASFVLVCDNEFKIRETIIGNIHDKQS